jgi:arylsulfatase A-like enzyme
VFERAYSTSPWTLPAFGSLLTGRIPSEHFAGLRLSTDGSANFSPLSPAIPTLAELLGVRYWATAAVVSNPFLHPGAGIARGFDTYDHDVARRKADAAVDAALAWLAGRGEQRFLLLLHLFDPHLPYDAPPPFRERFTGPRPADELRLDLPAIREVMDRGEKLDVEFLRNAYDEEIAFVDHELGRFLGELEARGLLRRTLVVLTADHGEEFFEHGAFEHGHSVFDEVVRVPLVIWGPGVDPGRAEGPVSLRDIPATVLSELDIAAPPGFAGRSLLASGAPETVVAEHTLYGRERKTAIAWPWKLHWAKSGEELALFDLAADPAERTNLWPERKTDAQPLFDELSAIAAQGSTALERAGVEIDPETRERLRELGYLE